MQYFVPKSVERVKSYEEIAKEINFSEYYIPREIADNQWILTFDKRPSYWHILKLISAGELKSVTYNLSPGKPRYKVRGSDILEYLKRRFP